MKRKPFLVLLAFSLLLLSFAGDARAITPATGNSGYAIITTNAISENSANLNNFVSLKQSLGYTVKVVTETDYGALTGQAPNGQAEKIRQWLIDNYQTLGIKYVLLVGNPDPIAGDIPMQKFWTGYDWPDETNGYYPSDLFYADLKCNYDLDNDQVFSEYKTVDAPNKPDMLSDKDSFSVIWKGYVKPTYSETYNFKIFHTNGVRLWIDGQQVINDWNLHTNTGFAYGTMFLSAGLHTIELRYFKDVGDAIVTLEWRSPSENGGNWDFGLKRWLYHDVAGTTEPGLDASYYENMDFTGFAQTKIDDSLNFAWSTGDRGPGGIDTHADVYVGRIPVYDQNYAQLDMILQKMINYETASGDLSWRKTMLLPAAMHTTLMQTMKSEIADTNGFRSFRLSNEPPYEAILTPQNVENEWKNGYGVVTWFTHGSSTYAENVFSNYQAANLNNAMPSFVCAVSCNNAYPEDRNNLAYSLLKNGAVSVVAATRTSWFDYLDGPQSSNWQYAGYSLMNERLGYYYTKYLIEDQNTAGEALFRAKALCILDDSVGSINSYENACEFSLYGDPACSLFTTAAICLEPGFSPGFWKHNLGVALGFSKGMPSAFAGGPYDGMKCDATLIASKVTKLQATELYSTLCTGDGGVNAQARLDAANYLNALFGYSPYH